MGLSCVSMKTLKNHERMDVSWAKHVYNTEISVEKRLEHGLPYKSRISFENNVLHTIFTNRAFKAFLGRI